MTEPTTGRPHMPGYGVPDTLEGALPWNWALERLEKCRNYFVATVRPDGRPHVMPIWGLWLDNVFCFSTAITSTKSRNLLKDPRCAITIEDGHQTVIVEGVARVTQLSEVPGFKDGYGKKYGFENMGPIGDGPIWTMKPTVAYAFQETDEFSTSATRWAF